MAAATIFSGKALTPQLSSFPFPFSFLYIPSSNPRFQAIIGPSERRPLYPKPTLAISGKGTGDTPLKLG
ncbi:hypothetical protein CCACVL1_16352 [Corchorus capsularis]|uniref:Uncharacterized protein n=1 Tax=Corchorus capsularis TaxID=210143 RepID=A0A1R3HXG5_COCAP|nr:hypothetical protein CCACVL1_16352 [Corchorus capsularis]